jgi:hypothetical protein
MQKEVLCACDSEFTQVCNITDLWKIIKKMARISSLFKNKLIIFQLLKMTCKLILWIVDDEKPQKRVLKSFLFFFKLFKNTKPQLPSPCN